MDNLDAEMVFVFVRNMLDYYMGSQVLLADGSIGTIIYIDRNNITRPLIRLKDSGKIIDYRAERNPAIIKIIDA